VPPIPKYKLDAVKLWILCPEIRIGDMQPATTNVHRFMLPCENLNSSANSSREVEIRCVAKGEVRVGAKSAARQFDVRF